MAHSLNRYITFFYGRVKHIPIHKILVYIYVFHKVFIHNNKSKKFIVFEANDRKAIFILYNFICNKMSVYVWVSYKYKSKFFFPITFVVL